MVTSNEMKSKARRLGADLCGIAAADRFAAAPDGFRPTDVYPACRSVIVIARRLPPAIFGSRSPSPYTIASKVMREAVLDTIAVELCNWLYDRGVGAIPVPSSDPYDYWDAARKHGRGIVSLRHAGELAGLGRIGRNTLLANEKYGNAINLAAVLADAQLQPDARVEETYCGESCRKCIEACPAGALDGTTVDQKRCREHTYYPNSRGHDVTWCSTCRSICPNRCGLTPTMP